MGEDNSAKVIDLLLTLHKLQIKAAIFACDWSLIMAYLDRRGA